MKKVWPILVACCVIFVLIIIILILGILGYLYFTGGKFALPNILSFNSPKDLGVKYSELDLQKGRDIANVQFENLPESSDTSIQFSGQKEISGTYTSEMITAMINAAEYKYYPLTNTQVLIHPDGTLESSGNIDINKLLQWANDISGDNSIAGLESYSNSIISNPSFYISGTMSVTDNNLDLNVDNAQISFFKASSEQISEYTPSVESFIEQQISNVPGMYVKSANFSSGQLILDATYPAIEKTIKK